MPVSREQLMSFFNALSGQAQPSIAPNGNLIQPEWQQEMLRTFDPATQRQQALRQAILAASQALATTPGHVGTGLAQGAVAGGGAYGDAMDNASLDRIKALKSVFDAQQDQARTGLNAGLDINREERDAANDEALRDWRRRPQIPRGTRGGTGGTKELLQKRKEVIDAVMAEHAVDGEIPPESRAAATKMMQDMFMAYGLTTDGMDWDPRFKEGMTGAAPGIAPDDAGGAEFDWTPDGGLKSR